MFESCGGASIVESEDALNKGKNRFVKVHFGLAAPALFAFVFSKTVLISMLDCSSSHAKCFLLFNEVGTRTIVTKVPQPYSCPGRARMLACLNAARFLFFATLKISARRI